MVAATLPQRREIELVTPLFARASELLAQIGPLADELATLGPQFPAAYIGVLFAAVGEQVRIADRTVQAARPQALDFALDPTAPIIGVQVTQASPSSEG